MRDIAGIRQPLLTTARRLVDRDGARLDVAALAAASGLAPSAIGQAYDDFDNLLSELLGTMYDEVRDLVTKLTLNMPAGPARLRLALDAYLQALLERPGLTALAQRLRLHPRGAAVIRQRVHGFSLMLRLELQAGGWPAAEAAARLCIAALITAASAEAAAGRKLPELRETLIDYFATARS